jgi:Ca2+-transporting ATPase
MESKSGVAASCFSSRQVPMISGEEVPLGGRNREKVASRGSATGAGSSGPGEQWHLREVADIIRALETRAEGLTDAEAAGRLRTLGPNLIPRGRRDTALDLLWRQLNNPLIWVLIAASVIAMAVDPDDGVKNGLVILMVVVLNTLIGFVQEFKASRAIEALSRLVPENVTVMRGGRTVTVPSADLVPGDMVHLASGDRVPADMRLVTVRNLQVEEAALTGESVPVEKQIDPVPNSPSIGDRTCMVFGGTMVTYGRGTAVVVATGGRTELGRIARMLRETTDLQTPLGSTLATIARYIAIAIVVLALALLAFGTWRTVAETGVTWLAALRETVIFAVALAVGAIPEGLPAIVTIALAVGVQRMAARHVVIRKLPAVETLGSTTVICTDKTGTLTRNEMTVRRLWTPASGALEVTGVGYAPSGWFERDGARVPASPDVADLLLAGTLCSDATIEAAGDQWAVHGDPTEGALVVAAAKTGIEAGPARRQHPRLDAIPFESVHQFMATLHANGGGRILMKGAPEAVLARCHGAAGAPLEAAPILREVAGMAAHGMRVLAVAAKPAGGRTRLALSDVESGFDLLGLAAMMDPPRPEAIDAIARCHGAGITVKMITGDHKATAEAIADQCGIRPSAPGTPRVIEGSQLAGMPAEARDEAAQHCNVFARVAPEHKLALVRSLQARDHVVAMTGDGVNDAPALKQANIGVAMGITGTSAAKESAAIIITDDNFASLAAAVEEGRRIYDNLVKSLAFILPTNLGLALILACAVVIFPFAEVAPAAGAAAGAARELLLPISPLQLLWINLVAAVALALPLAFEAREPGVMTRPPRAPGSPVLSRFVLLRTLAVAVLMTAGAIGLFLSVYTTAGGAGQLAYAQTMATTTVIMFQVFYLLNCRSLHDSLLQIGLFSNPTVFGGIAAVVALQAMFIYAPFMHAIFGSAPLAANDLLLAVLVGSLILPVVGAEKWWRRRSAARR